MKMEALNFEPVSNEVLREEIFIQARKQKIFARMVGVTESYLSNVINGYVTPSHTFVQRACKVLDKHPAELFPGNGAK